MMKSNGLARLVAGALLIWLGFDALPGGGASAASPGTMPPPAQRRPNIVLIVADDLGYGDLGCYGQEKIKTPNLDRLAAEGMRFTQFYAGTTVCAPSRCALMTGLDTGHTRVRENNGVALRPEDVTLAELLKQHGYHTGLIGKWGLGDENSTGMPQDQGFDEFGGYLNQTHAHDYYSDHLFRYDPQHGFSKMELSENRGGKKELYIPDLLVIGAQNFIRFNKPESLNHYRPFFLYFAPTLPHANNEEGRRSGNGMQIPDDQPYGDQPWPQVEKNKAAMISRLDLEVGQLLGQLQKLKLEDNTLVLFTSDNGPHKEGGVDPKFFNSSGGLRGIKRDLYEGGLRVPLIGRWPGKIKPGQVSDLVSAFWDILPTGCEVAGVQPPAGLDGISLLPTLLGHAQTNRHEFLYWEFHEGGFHQAVRYQDWKAVRPGLGAPLELYNLKQDPAEKHDVAKENPQVVARIEAFLKTARTEPEAAPARKATRAAKPRVEQGSVEPAGKLQP